MMRSLLLRLLSRGTLRRLVWLQAFATALALFVTACGAVKRPDGGTGLLPIGAPAPDLVAKDASSHDVHLNELRGRPVIVYFYPKDGTPGCTKEACAFRDAWDKLAAAHVEVIGVSTNTEERHREFRKDEHLQFPLASDEAGTIGKAFGVEEHVWGYARVSFLIDRQGRVAKVWPDVDPAVHANEVLEAAASLQ